MRDYADQIARLRECASNSHEVHLKCGAYLSGVCAKTRDIRMQDAADAIEELQGKLKELYYLTCDINANEINAQIEWGNLDNFLRAFRKYADKIAGMKLSEPPKGVE